MLLAIGAAVLSAAFFGASSALEQRAASTDSKDDLSGVRLLEQLAHEPRWWLGLALSAVAFALHAVAACQSAHAPGRSQHHPSGQAAMTLVDAPPGSLQKGGRCLSICLTTRPSTSPLPCTLLTTIQRDSTSPTLNALA